MLIFKPKKALISYLSLLRMQGNSIGFIPTMGALHAGHLSLLQAAKERCDLAVCSIFVNPTQFNDLTDYQKYPVHTDSDIQILTEAGADILFLPSMEEIYEKGTQQLETYDFGYLDNLLEGAFRPGHFQGVGQVMARLLGIILPDQLFMGQKDFQQTLIINKLIKLKALKTDLIVCPVVREKDGLAMSSRNARLSPEARGKAPLIFKTLQFIKANFHAMPLKDLLDQATKELEMNGFQVDYLTIADESLKTSENARQGKLICLIAVWIEGIRLIDNIIISQGF